MSETIICPRCKTRVEIVELFDVYQIQAHHWAMRRRSEPCPASNLPVRGNWRNDPTYQREQPPTRELLVELDGDEG